MASEAQRLIGISLTKIAQSRANRGGVSLHKNLLVATVLQKARYIFMEEAYNMVHYQTTPTPVQSRSASREDLVGLTAEEAGIDAAPLAAEDVGEASNLEFLQPVSCVKCNENQDKENQAPFISGNNNNSVGNSVSSSSSSEVTYLDLDNKTSSANSSSVLRERSASPCLKRRRAVTDWETEEAVQSILPKRVRCAAEEGDDSVFLDDATILSDSVSKELEESERATTTTTTQEFTNSGSAMEIDRITSLVSIFSFGMGSEGNKLSRSVSTPDLCSAQAKDTGDALQQRPFIAMTV